MGCANRYTSLPNTGLKYTRGITIREHVLALVPWDWCPRTVLKEYYEIVTEARPLSGFFPTHADFFTEMHF